LTELVAGAGTNIVIKNNIFYTTTNLGYATGLFLENALSNYQIDNNIYYAPNKGGPLWFTIQGVNQVKTGFTDWQATGADVHGRYADPLFVSTDSSSPDFLKLSANSPARGAGAGVPVFCDFAGAVRPAGQPTDAGAWLYGSSSVRPSLPLVKWYPDRAIPASGAFDLRGRAVQMKERRSMCGAAGILILRPALSVSQASATPVISYGLVTSK
jgi:hypothetical protein